LVAGLPEQNIRIIAPDIGGGFGNKVPIYPGYVCAVVASLQLGRPVKWIESRSENLQSTGFARDYHMTAEIAADQDGRVKALRVKTLADHGAFNAAAQPSKFPAGLFSMCTGSYDFSEAFCEVDGVYTNKATGGIAYRCSFRVTEAAYLIERAMDVLAQELKMDPVELRLKNFIPPEKFPYLCPLGWSYDSGDYKAAMDLALEKIGYHELRKEQEEKRRQGELMGIGVSSFTEIVGAGPSHTFDICGIKMFEASEEDLEWEPGKFFVRGAPSKSKTIQEISFAAYTNFPAGLEPGLEAVHYYDPPNLTSPFGTYICVLDIDKGTGEPKVRRFVAVDDCGNIINPMIVEGQIHGGLTEGLAIAFMQELPMMKAATSRVALLWIIWFRPRSRLRTGRPAKRVRPSPHHPVGAKGVGESPNVGSPAAFVNAVVDALSHLGVKHIDMPIAPWKIWKILKEKGISE
jgi:CO/xanthine dehydrogenase Mo-binding subunit